MPVAPRPADGSDKPAALVPIPPLSASAKPRPLQQRTVKENKHAATCSPKVPQGAKGRNTGIATRGNSVAFGDFGLKSTDRGRLTARQIEAARRAISRHVKRGGRIWIRVFPDKPISTKPAEVRMGNGKGNPEYYVAEIQPGKVLYEIVACPKSWPVKRSPGCCQAAAAHDLRARTSASKEEHDDENR
jgi:large subunit ribosomal protein L16